MQFADRNVAADPSHIGHDEQIVLDHYSISTTEITEFRAINVDAKAEMSARFDATCKKLFVDFRAWLLKEKHPEQFETYYFPKNAWQCLVNDYAPQWYVQMFPVKYTELKVRVVGDVYVCPHHQLAWENQAETHLEFLHGKTEK